MAFGSTIGGPTGDIFSLNRFIYLISRVFFSLQVNEYGDLMLDIAEAFMSQRLFQESVGFLKQLVENENYSKAAVWLRFV